MAATHRLVRDRYHSQPPGDRHLSDTLRACTRPRTSDRRRQAALFPPRMAGQASIPMALMGGAAPASAASFGWMVATSRSVRSPTVLSRGRTPRTTVDEITATQLDGSTLRGSVQKASKDRKGAASTRTCERRGGDSNFERTKSAPNPRAAQLRGLLNGTRRSRSREAIPKRPERTRLDPEKREPFPLAASWNNIRLE